MTRGPVFRPESALPENLQDERQYKVVSFNYKNKLQGGLIRSRREGSPTTLPPQRTLALAQRTYWKKKIQNRAPVTVIFAKQSLIVALHPHLYRGICTIKFAPRHERTQQTCPSWQVQRSWNRSRFILNRKPNRVDMHRLNPMRVFVWRCTSHMLKRVSHSKPIEHQG